MTIEERAKDRFCKDCIFPLFQEKDACLECSARDTYIEIAEEMKAIAIKAFDETCGWLSTYPWYQGVRDEFIKALDR